MEIFAKIKVTFSVVIAPKNAHMKSKKKQGHIHTETGRVTQYFRQVDGKNLHN